MLVQLEVAGRVCARVCKDGNRQARLWVTGRDSASLSGGDNQRPYRTIMSMLIAGSAPSRVSATTGTLAKGKRKKVNITAGENHSNS